MSGSLGKHDAFENKLTHGQPNAMKTVAASQHRGSRVIALHIEFVAKPSEAQRVHAALPSAIQETLEGVAGFAGAFVMVSHYEARLVTVVTLWAGADRAQRCEENVRWVRALLAPYLDRCLRVQTLATYLPPAPLAVQEFQPSSVLGTMDIDEQEVSAFVA